MVLTVDLTRGSDRPLEPEHGTDRRRTGRHGTFRDVISEGASAGFELVRNDVVREWGDVEVDIGLIVMRRTGIREAMAACLADAFAECGRSAVRTDPIAV